MENPTYPWRVPRELGEVLADARAVFASLGVIEFHGGCTDAQIANAEDRMQRPLPGEVREFYRVMRPTELFASGTRKEFGFYLIDSAELQWQSMQGAEPPQDWTEATGLALGQSAFGDPFWWVEGHRSLPNGSIVLLDHDGGLGGDVMFVHFARSFREFIAKVTYFKGLYSSVQDPLFQSEYVELNPSAKR